MSIWLRVVVGAVVPLFNFVCSGLDGMDFPLFDVKGVVNDGSGAFQVGGDIGNKTLGWL